MRSVRDLHDEAMGLAVAAQRAHESGNIKEEVQLALLACDLERQAAIQLDPIPEDEPTRSILFCSAASLAWQGGDNMLCERLCYDGLRGFPPPEYKDDFHEFIEKINAARHLEIKGVELRESEFQFSIAGDYIIPGMAPIVELTKRLGHFASILDQRIRLNLGIPFDGLRKKSQGYVPEFVPYVASLRPASLALTIGLARPTNKPLPLPIEGVDVNPSRLIDEFITDMKILSEGDIQTLEKKMGNNPYLVHFLAHAKEIAPDGKRVRMVGLSRNDRKIAFMLPRAEFKTFFSSTNDPVEGGVTSLRGALNQADKDKGFVGLIVDGRDKVKIKVREGLEDIVRSHFGKIVDVTGYYSKKFFMMDSIDPVEEDTEV